MRRAMLGILMLIPSVAFAQTPASAAGATRPNVAPEVTLSDEMLSAPPPAPRSIATWNEAMALMRARSTDLRVAYDEVERAEGQVRAALGAALPAINAQGSYTHQFISSTTDQVIAVQKNGNPIFAPYTAPQPDLLSGNVQLTEPIINVEAWHAIGTAKASVEAAKLSFDDLKRTVAQGAATAIVGVVAAERVADLNRVGLRQAIERYQIAQRKRQIGGGTLLDALRARRDVEIARASLLSGDDALLRAREALGLALGIGGSVGVATSVGIEDVERSCTKLDSLDVRADIVAQKKRVEVAQRNVTDVYEQFLPTLSGIALLNWTNLEQGPVPATSFSLEALLNVPIWDGGIRYGYLRQTRALHDEEKRKLEALLRQAQVQIEQAEREVVVAQRQRDVASTARDLAAQTDELTRLAFQTGQGTSLDLVVAAAELRQAEIGLALQEFGLVRARIGAVLVRARCPW
jgi:multidrug efflux system outer membrane protein